MNLKDIAVFKKFIADKDLRREFIRVYNRSKSFAKLPKTIEEYFSNVDPYAVITKAARVCKPNSTYGYSFWQELNEDWKEYFKKMQSSHFYQELTGKKTLTGYFNILRENWNDVEKPWVFEDIKTARQRLGLEPLPPQNEDNNKEELSEIMDAEFEEDDIDIDFVEFSSNRRTANALKKGIISSNTRGHSYRVTFNRIDTKDVRKKKVGYAMVGKAKSGDVMIMFCNNDKGIPIVFNTDDYLNINSRQFVDNFNRLLGITEDLAYLRIEKVSEKMDSITYKVTKQ